MLLRQWESQGWGICMTQYWVSTLFADDRVVWANLGFNSILYCTVITYAYSRLQSANTYEKKKTPESESASEIYRLSDRSVSAKLMKTFADEGCRVDSVTEPYGRNFGFLGRCSYFFFQVAPQLYLQGWMDPVPDPLLLRNSGSAGNRTRTSGSVARNSDH
jgi:hypothetical protein